MTPSQRIARHLRGNLVGYIALFVALSGTALALPGKNSVKSNDLARGAVNGRAITDGAVGKSKIRPASVTSAAIDDGSVVSADLGDGAVTGTKITDEAVGRAKIEQGSINGGKLANGSVNSAKVNDGSLLAEDFAAGQLSEGFVSETDPANFTLPRGGRLFINAVFLTGSCPVANCTYSVTVDGAAVAGTAMIGDYEQQATLTGVSAPLAAGDHTVDIVTTGGATVADPTIAAVLLQ